MINYQNSIFHIMPSKDILDIKHQIEILSYLSNHLGVDTSQIIEALNINWRQVNYILNKRSEDGYVVKKRKDRIFLGGEKYNYTLTERGFLFLKELKEILARLDL